MLATSPAFNTSRSSRSMETSGKSRPWSRIAPALALILLFLLGNIPALALVHFDFDQKYFVHPDRQVWDFSMVQTDDDIYHIFYHTIHTQTPHASNGDTIWHATSTNLKQWIIEGPILTVGQNEWDAGALWAPDIFYDQENGQWTLAYTACDAQMNQRIAFASSPDLNTWVKSPLNPVLEPDLEDYTYNPEGWWSDFRDPFIFRHDEQYHILVTAKQWLGRATGVLYHGVSDDLVNWEDVGIFFANDGIDPWRVLESPQYKVLNDRHYLFFGEYDTSGISAVAADTMGNWTMDNRQWIDYGYAPEVDHFDKVTPIFSRIAPYQIPATDLIHYAVRIDTLLVHEDGSVEPHLPNPLAEHWASYTGTACLAQPTFGDNPAMRGDDPAGPVGNGYFGSAEYYQGPLSGRGSPGTMLGDAATGTLESPLFRVLGNRMTMLVGGGNYPETCRIGLMDARTDTVILSETGLGEELMTLREWDLRPLRGRFVYLQIMDAETGPMGHINVDEIREDYQLVSSAGPLPPAGSALRHLAYPNPFNPRTTIRFELGNPQEARVQIHDLRGHLVWNSPVFPGAPGFNSVIWEGRDQADQAVAAGTYMYSIVLDGRKSGQGKVMLVK